MARPRIVRPPLTKRAIDAARPAEKDRFLWDGAEHGLAVKVTPAGTKVFILQKTVQGRLKRITLGAFGDLTLDAARNRARRLNGEIAIGRDPVAEALAERKAKERQARLELSVDDLWQRYAAEVIAVGNKPSTIAGKVRMWERRIKPAIGALKVKDVTEADLSAVIRSPIRLDDKSVAIGGRAEAGNLYRLLHHMFRKALSWGARPRELGNPLAEINEPKVERRKRLLSASEVSALSGELDRSLAAGDEAAAVLGAVKAAIHTGARISELLGLRWDDIRRDESEIHLRDTKTGPSQRPISADALAVFDSVGRDMSPFVFRSPSDPSAPLAYGTVEKAFRRIRERAGLRNCSLHSLRHWFATLTANSVSNPRVGMALTGHRSHAAYMGYVHADREQAHALAAQIGAFASSLAGAPSNVVNIQKARG